MQKSFLSQIVGHHVKYEFTRDLDSVMPMGPISIPQNPVQISQPPLMPAMRPPFMNNPQPRMPMVAHREPMGCTTSRPMVNPMRPQIDQNRPMVPAVINHTIPNPARPPISHPNPPMMATNQQRPMSTNSGTTNNSGSSQSETRNKSNYTHRKFDSAHLDILLGSYAENAYPSTEEVNYLVSVTSLSFKQVRKWFEKERYRRKLKGEASIIYNVVRHPAWAVDILSNYFSTNHYPSRDEVIRLSDATKLQQKSVRKWFERKRQRMRRTLGVTIKKQPAE